MNTLGSSMGLGRLFLSQTVLQILHEAVQRLLNATTGAPFGIFITRLQDQSEDLSKLVWPWHPYKHFRPYHQELIQTTWARMGRLCVSLWSVGDNDKYFFAFVLHLLSHIRIFISAFILAGPWSIFPDAGDHQSEHTERGKQVGFCGNSFVVEAEFWKLQNLDLK